MRILSRKAVDESCPRRRLKHCTAQARRKVKAKQPTKPGFWVRLKEAV